MANRFMTKQQLSKEYGQILADLNDIGITADVVFVHNDDPKRVLDINPESAKTRDDDVVTVTATDLSACYGIVCLRQFVSETSEIRVVLSEFNMGEVADK